MRVLKAFIAPLLWTFFLSIEIILLADKTSTSAVVKVFEGFVFATSFLFFTAGGLSSFVGGGFLKALTLFGAQFFFWWLVGFMFLTFKNKKGSV